MKRIVVYEIEEDLAQALKKITGKLSDIDMSDKFKLTISEMQIVHEFYDLVESRRDE